MTTVRERLAGIDARVSMVQISSGLALADFIFGLLLKTKRFENKKTVKKGAAAFRKSRGARYFRNINSQSSAPAETF